MDETALDQRGAGEKNPTNIRMEEVLTGEVNFFLLLVMEILLGQGIETGRHDREWRGQRQTRECSGLSGTDAQGGNVVVVAIVAVLQLRAKANISAVCG